MSSRYLFPSSIVAPGVSPAVAGVSRSRSDEQTEAEINAAFQGAAPPRFSSISIRHRGRLPHWQKECGLYFVTFRTWDSLPKQRVAELRRELQLVGKFDRPSQKQFEELLDRGAGSCPFADPRCANAVADALRSLDGQRYRLIAWCVMPNHVHFVARLLPGVTVSEVMHSLKSFSAKRVNAILKRGGALWEREYYDRLIRNSDELQRVTSYVARNPERAGLKDWKWVECRAQDAPGTAGETPALP